MVKFRMNVPETMINGQEQRPWGRGYGAHLHCLVNTELQSRNRFCVYFRLNLPAYNKFDIFPRTPSTPSLLAPKIKPECACQFLLGLNTRLLALSLHQCIAGSDVFTIRQVTDLLLCYYLSLLLKLCGHMRTNTQR